MDSFNYDEKGVPVLSAVDIENKAEEVLIKLAPRILVHPQKTPVLSILDEFEKQFSVKTSIGELGFGKTGKKIIGRFWLESREISIDKSIVDTVRFPFVVAHEIGHLVLHRKLQLKAEDDDIKNDDDDFDHNLTQTTHSLKTSKDWLEWQANKFASSFLMPKKTFIFELIEVQNILDIRSNLGRIYVEEKEYSIRDYKNTVSLLAERYAVGFIHTEIRLKDLKLIDDHRQ